MISGGSGGARGDHYATRMDRNILRKLLLLIAHSYVCRYSHCRSMYPSLTLSVSYKSARISSSTKVTRQSALIFRRRSTFHRGYRKWLMHRVYVPTGPHTTEVPTGGYLFCFKSVNIYSRISLMPLSWPYVVMAQQLLFE
jgi:hypothetical protein